MSPRLARRAHACVALIVAFATNAAPSGKVARLADGQPAQGGDLMTTGTFRDFELAFQWKVAPGSNSGVDHGDEAYYRNIRIRVLP